MQKLLIASRNQGKIKEIKQILQDFKLEVISLDQTDLPPDFDVEEPAMTFEGNALIKAITIGNKTGLLTLADDSGLEVDALNGAPGVYSARYTTETDKDRCDKLLNKLKDVPSEKRTAQFRCVMAIYNPHTKKIRSCEGIYKGLIINEFHGENGFGYDPIFFNQKLQKTNAEMTTEEKNSVSHRGITLKKAKQILQTEFM